MSGILDNKTRMLDTIITHEGRRQMAAGDLRIRFVSFTDAETFYEQDAISGSSDPSDRIFLEAASLPQDQITFEADDSGLVNPFRGSDLGVLAGKVLSGSTDAFLVEVTGSAFTSTAETLLDASIDNFQKLYVVRTENQFFDNESEFSTNVNSIKFAIGDTSPLGRKEVKRINIDKVENLFQDKRLSHLPNYMYLPPINRTTPTDPEGTPLGDYPLLGQRIDPLTFEELERDLMKRTWRVVEFSQTTLLSNVLCQFFEIRQDRLLKLNAIDFGEVVTDDPDFPNKRVYFVGKVFIDSFGAHTFVNMFTLVFE